MPGIQQISGSFIQSGSIAKFQSGVRVGSTVQSHDMNINGSIRGTFTGNGSALTNLNFSTSDIRLFVGSSSNTNPPTFKPWITGSNGNSTHEITLSTSSSGGQFNHFTFLRNSTGQWAEVSDYTGTINGLLTQNSLTEELGTGIHRYLLLAMSTASKQTIVEGATVIINPGSL